ncbi:hypothetical protein CAEBREN_00766 [Caenorhabditis brenneri]|uniref:BTB domain-containing protein n=1 Tax=Caenorhabditis brenneri TaxID=135651 RepID=G0MVZ2_CAEBE|nr:hypothetical protein CAEBREN_00766 [Caenorhabditis brenneri]
MPKTSDPSIYEKAFAKSDKTDAILVVDGKKLHVNKALQEMTETPELTIYEKAFVKSDKTDAILVVGGKKLHVNKALLSYHSEYFNTLFNSEFKEKSIEEIEIKDVEFEDFATLLSLIHEKPLDFNMEYAENLLKLADRFLLNSTKLLIAIVIKNSTEFDQFDKLLLADKYGLEDLLSHILTLYNTKDKFKDFYEYNWLLPQLSDATKLKLFEKYFKSGFCL